MTGNTMYIYIIEDHMKIKSFFEGIDSVTNHIHNVAIFLENTLNLHDFTIFDVIS